MIHVVAARFAKPIHAPIAWWLSLVLCAFADSALAQGSIENGTTQTGVISPAGDSDSWTFSATTGERILVRMGEIAQTNAFNPRLRLLTPAGVEQESASAGAVVELDVIATDTGTFTLIVDNSSAAAATASYRVSLAKLPGTIGVEASDEGGAMTNGMLHTGSIGTGELDVWTFDAVEGDAVAVRIGEIADAGGFAPWIRVYDETGTLVRSDFGSTAGEAAFTPATTGTFFVVVSDGNASRTGAGTYRLSLGKTGAAVVIAPGDDGGPLTNGITHTGTILTGDLDVWTFDAADGDSVVIRVGEISETNSFSPWLRMYSESGELVASGFGAVAGEGAYRIDQAGTYLVIVADGNASLSGSGTYRLTLAKTGVAISISAGDEGGSLTNAFTHTGTIDVGDVDAWHVTAAAGDALVVRAGEIVDAGSFAPWIRVYNPDGTLLSSGFGSWSAEAAGIAPSAGLYLVVIADGNASYSGRGTYRLTLMKTGSPVSISDNNEGGALTNGVLHQGEISLGDLDVWQVDAEAGQRLVVRVGQVLDQGSFSPWVRLYSPGGVLIDSGFGSWAGEAIAIAPTNGSYLITVADGNASLSGTGTYQLTLAKTGELIVVSPGDEGGRLTNGLMHSAEISIGDVDAWWVDALAGDRLIVRAGEIMDFGSFSPWIRIFGPNGELLDSGFGSFSGEAAITTPTNGTYLVLVADGNASYSGSGTYRLTLAMTRTGVSVQAGDEGGPLNAGNPAGTIELGDLDVFSFAACAGDAIQLRLNEVVDNGSFNPWLRLLGPDGTSLGTSSGSALAQINIAAPVAGRYLIVVGDGNASLSGMGTYDLQVNGLSDEMKLCLPVPDGTNVHLVAIGGVPGTTVRIVTATSVSASSNAWIPISTNTFSSVSDLVHTNRFHVQEPQRYYRLVP